MARGTCAGSGVDAMAGLGASVWNNGDPDRRPEAGEKLWKCRSQRYKKGKQQ